MAGYLPLHAFQLGLEATKGTAVATTRELYPSPTGYFDPGVQVAFHEGAQRGTYSNITHGTLTGYAPTIGFASEDSHGLTFDDLVYPGSQLQGAQTGAGAGADKTWAFSPVQGGAWTYDTFTANMTDGQQAFELAYVFGTDFSITMGDPEGLTQWSMSMVGRTPSKVTIDAVAANNAVKVTNAGWTVKYATAESGLTGASVLSNTLRSFALNVDLPVRPRKYGGSTSFGQGQPGMNLSGTLSMVWDATDDAETQYDRWLSQSVSFFRLTNTGPTLGSGTYLATIDAAVLWEQVQPFASESDGVMEYAMNGRLVYDATWAQALTIDVVNSIATVP